jgi:putative transcriptional regulator
MFATFTVTASQVRRARRPGRFWAPLLALAVLLAAVLPGAPAHSAPTEGHWGDSLVGRLLIASENMGDPRFQNSVVYMVEHNAGGAMGLIVNDPLGAVPVARLFERLGLEPPEVAGEIEVYYGGPVETERGFLLHSADVVLDGSVQIDEEVAITASSEMLGRIAGGEGPEKSIFAFGYSGWGPGQLESELARGDWFVIPADASLIFAVNPAQSWERAAARRSLDL